MNTGITCPSTEALVQFWSGHLDDRAEAALGTHVDSCASCRTLLESLAAQSADPVLAELRLPPTEDSYHSEVMCRVATDRAAAVVEGSYRTGTEQMAAEPMPETVGSYRILGPLGSGGMGTVYRALHTELDKVVALKVLGVEAAGSGGSQRFKQEMKAVGRVSHPHLVTAFDGGVSDGRHFLVMELIDGIDLGKLSARLGPLAVADACELARQAAVGLEHIHGRGLVHRDVKPSNLMLARADGAVPTVKILDLGLALFTQAPLQLSGEMTPKGQIMGTLDYMAPEQALNSSTVDHRADLYGLGASLRKLLTGRSRFGGRQGAGWARNLAALIQEPIPSIAKDRPDVPSPLVELIDALVAFDPAARPSSAAEVATRLASFAVSHDLGKLLEADTVPPTVADASERLREGKPSRHRHRRWVLGLAGLAAAVLVVLAVLFYRPHRDTTGVPPPPTPAPVEPTTGHALAFDGVSSHVLLPTLRRDNANDPITLEAWLAPDQSAGHEVFVIVGGTARCQISRRGLMWAGIDYQQGNVTFRYAHSSKKRLHMAFSADPKMLRLFLDGKLVVARETSGPPAFADDEPFAHSWLGAHPDRLGHMRYWFKGTMNEVHISKGARYDKDFTPAARHKPDADTVALYHCDEGRGDVLTDSSGNGHHGRIVGATWTKVDDAARPLAPR